MVRNSAGFHRLGRLVAALVAILLFVRGVGQASVLRDDRAPVPAEAVQAKFRRELKEAYAAEYRATDPAERVALGARLEELGKAIASNEADLRYVMLMESAKSFAAAADLTSAQRSIDELGRQFRVDSLAAWFAFLRGLKNESLPTPAERARHYLAIAEHILKERDPINDPVDYPRKTLFEDAMQIALSCLEIMQPGNATTALRADRDELKAWAKELDEFRSQRAALAKNRADPAANAFVGRFLCVRVGDWTQGLKYLRDGEGAAAELARKELADATSAEELAAIGDGWKQLADAERSARRVSAALRAHAAEIYRRAIAVLPKESFLAEKVKRKLSDIEIDASPEIASSESGVGKKPAAATKPIVAFDGKYARRASREGGAESAIAVDSALDWLARHQHRSGYWSSAGFSMSCVDNRCSGEGDPTCDIGVTGLALLAFLGSGNTPTSGEHQEIVARGIRWLITTQDPRTGLFGEINSHQGYHYDHAIATHAVIEAFGLGKDETLRQAAEKAVKRIERAHNPYQAWRYAFPANGENDMSVTGYMVHALCAARDFGIEIDEATLEQAMNWIDSMTDDATGRVGYITQGGFSAREPGMAERWPESKVEPMTAAALCCRFAIGGAAKGLAAIATGSQVLRKSLPTWDEAEGTIDLHYWYYGSQATWQLGGGDWDAWQRALHRALLATQRDEGDERGSWDPQYDPWGHKGGRVYSTAMAALSLEAPYRYTRPKTK